MPYKTSILFCVIMLLSCGQNDNKQKELELKEKELTIREKELDFRKDSLSTTSTQKDTHLLPAKKNTDSEKDWNIFYNEFKESVRNNDFNKIQALTANTFNGYTDSYGGISIMKWLTEKEYLDFRKKSLQDAFYGRITKKGNYYYTGDGNAGDFQFINKNDKWLFNGFIIIEGD